MAWIEEIDAGEAQGKLAEVYAELEKKRGRISNILMVQSLNPDALGEHLKLYKTLMFGRSGLSRLEREAIAVVVSANNDCEYCVNHHAESLRFYLDDEEDTLNLLMSADGLETLEPRLSNIVRHAEKLTNVPGAMTESDLCELRAVGLSDKDILDLTMITGYFNFVNRVAVGLGVDFSADDMRGHEDEPI